MDKNSKTIGEIRASGTFTTSNNFGVNKAQQIGSRMIDYALEATTFQKDSIDQKNKQWAASGEAVVLADLLGCQSPSQYSNPEEFIRLRNLAFRSLQKVSGVPTGKNCSGQGFRRGRKWNGGNIKGIVKS